MEDKAQTLKNEIQEELNKLILKIQAADKDSTSDYSDATQEVLSLLVGKYADPNYMLEQYYNSNC